MKIWAWGFVSILFFSAVFSSQKVQAEEVPSSIRFEEFKIVGSNDPGDMLSRMEDTSFSFEERPYLYVKLEAPVVGSLKTLWTDEGAEESTRNQSLTLSSGLEFWLSPRYWWSSDRQYGAWQVSGDFIVDGELVDSRMVSFVVTPEPGALLLLAVGALPLGLGVKRGRSI